MHVFKRIDALQKAHRRVALVTVVKTVGATPRKAGARMLVFDDGSIEGSIGGGRVEHDLRQIAREALKSEKTEFITYELGPQGAMCCGGTYHLYVEPIVPEPHLYIFGCGHVGSALVRAAKPLGFQITAIDARPDFAAAERLPEATRFVNSFEKTAIDNLTFSDDVYIVLATSDHKLDMQLLSALAARPWRYLGVLGSTKKRAMQNHHLEKQGVDDAIIARIRCPIGVDIGAQGPEEIAVSICAELIAARRRVEYAT